MAAEAERRGIQLNTHTTADVLVSGDADLLAHLVWNLVGNAVKFTPDRADGAVFTVCFPQA